MGLENSRLHTQLEATLQAAPAAMATWTADAQGELRFVRVNRAYCQAAGLRQEEIEGRRVAELFLKFPGENRVALERMWRVLREGESIHVPEQPTLGFGNGVTYWRAKYAPVRDPEGQVVAGVFTGEDVTDLVLVRREMENLAEAAGQRADDLATIIESMADAVFVCDQEGAITLMNEAGRALIGYGVEGGSRTLAEYLASFQLHHHESRGPLSPAGLPVAQAARGETVQMRKETGIHPRTGKPVDLLISATPLRDPSDRVVGAVNVVRDVTELTELDRLKDQFIAVAAHELKTPVAIMKGYAQFLLRRGGDLAPDRLKMLDALNVGADRIDRVVQDLLDILRLQAGNLELLKERIDVAQLVEQVVDRMAITATRHRIRLVHAEPMVIRGDRGRLEQVVVNLIDNAIRYSPKGGDVVWM